MVWDVVCGLDLLLSQVVQNYLEPLGLWPYVLEKPLKENIKIFKLIKTGGKVLKQVASSASTGKRHRAMTPEAREEQLISAAIDLAEQQLLDGTASAQVITHFLKLGSTKEKIEKEILAEQKKLVEAKTQALQSMKRTEELYADALSAMRCYNGQESSGEEDDEY